MIDGHAILHRAFHALPPLTTSKGQPVGAVFGFCSMLLRVINDLKPQYLAVAFDLPAPTFRQKLFKAYQAQRPEMAEELSLQVKITHQVLQAMEIPIFEKEEYEADDVIGTLAMKAAVRVEVRKLKVGVEDRRLKIEKMTIHPQPSNLKKQPSTFYCPSSSLEIIIVTGDRDMLQLVGKKVKVLAPVAGITKMVSYDEETVEEKYGLKPSQWVDFKALVGDPSDNYPGVSGVGPKTATDLLKKYGTLEKIYQNLNQLPPKQKEALKEGKEQVVLAEKLAAIVTDVPVELDFEKCRLQSLKNPGVEKLFAELEFKSLWERVEKGDSAQKAVKKEKKKEVEDNQLSLLN